MGRMMFGPMEFNYWPVNPLGKIRKKSGYRFCHTTKPIVELHCENNLINNFKIIKSKKLPIIFFFFFENELPIN